MHRFIRRFIHRCRHRFEHRLRPEGKQLNLAQMRTGQSGVVVEIMGGHRMINRLSALGVRPGLIVTKTGSMLMRGPITIRAGNTQLAIGHGMANRVIVEPRESYNDMP